MNVEMSEKELIRCLVATVVLRAAIVRLERTAAKAGLGAPRPTNRRVNMGRFDEFEAYARAQRFTRNGHQIGKKGHRP